MACRPLDDLDTKDKEGKKCIYFLLSHSCLFHAAGSVVGYVVELLLSLFVGCESSKVVNERDTIFNEAVKKLPTGITQIQELEFASYQSIIFKVEWAVLRQETG